MDAYENYINAHGFNNAKSTCFLAKYTTAHIHIDLNPTVGKSYKSFNSKGLRLKLVPFVDHTEAGFEFASGPETVESPFMLTNLIRS